MKRFKFFVCLTVLFGAALAGYSQNFSRTQEIEKNTSPESFRFTAFNAEYVVDVEKGKAQKTVGGVKESFRIPLDKGDHVEKIYFSEYADDLFLFYEAGNGESGATEFARLDAKTNKLEWKIQLLTFNTEGILEDNYGYFAGVGFVANVNLTTGKFIWKHENLYTEEYGKIQLFAVPKIEADKVIFREDSTSPYGGKNEIVVEKNTGKILSVN